MSISYEIGLFMKQTSFNKLHYYDEVGKQCSCLKEKRLWRNIFNYALRLTLLGNASTVIGNVNRW